MRQVRKATQHPIAGGERVKIMTGGGGGWGAPSERDPEAVRRDVREGYVSAEAAQARLRHRGVVSACGCTRRFRS